MKRNQGIVLSKEVVLPRDAVTQTYAIMGKRESGKTYTASVLAEGLIKQKLHVVILDPLGVWWGLRASKDGKSEGLPIFIMGGKHGDVPLEPGSGAFVAELVVKKHISAIIDMRLLRQSEQKSFVLAFAERLFDINEDPIQLIIDEADTFAPQRPMKGEERMLGAVDNLIRRGRAKGIGGTVLCQRSAALNKNVTSQAEFLIAHRTLGKQDREAIRAWIAVQGDDEDRASTLMKTLPRLKMGEAIVWSPAWLDFFGQVQIRERWTFDSSATPKIGRKIRPPKKLARVDIERIREQIQGTIDRAKENDPKELKKQIVELRAQLAKKLPPVKGPAKTKTVEVKVPFMSKAILRKLEKFTKRLENIQGAFKKVMGGVGDLQAMAGAIPPEIAGLVKTWVAMTTSKAVVKSETKADFPWRTDLPGVVVKDIPPDLSDIPIKGLSAAEEKILKMIASKDPLKFSRSQLALQVGYTPKTLGNYSGRLIRDNLIEVLGDGTITLGSAGRVLMAEHIGNQQPQSPAEVQDMWISKLGPAQGKILRALIEVYPKDITREDLSTMTNYTVKTIGNYSGLLIRNGLITTKGQSLMAAESLMMPS